MPTIRYLHATRQTLHGCFSRDLEPALSIDSGDTVVFRTLDAAWNRPGRQRLGLDLPEIERDSARDTPGAHALTGPVFVRGALPGDVLEIQINAVQPGSWGWTSSGPFGAGEWLGLETEAHLLWRIDPDTHLAVETTGTGISVPIKPFMGIMGNAPAASGPHSTVPPRSTGGNIDCRELVTGSTLWLPIEVAGALFSTGDGHAAQGDGEVAGPAIEAPMERVELTLTVRKDLAYTLPQADTPAGWITFGFGETLDAAMRDALAVMVTHVQRRYGLSNTQAVALASCVVSLRVTQVVNGIVGVHAILPLHAFQLATQ